MNQIKSDDTVISLCVGRLLVSVLLAPSLTPDSLSVDLGPIALEKEKLGTLNLLNTR